MGLKYRIAYDDFSGYPHKRSKKAFSWYLIIVLLCAAAVLYWGYSSGDIRPYELLLPGDPAVTTDAFLQLAESLDRGEALSDALDVFCHTVMESR